MRPSLEEIGQNTEEAIEKALRKLGLSRDRVLVEILGQSYDRDRSARVKITPLGDIPEPLQASQIVTDILDKMMMPAEISLELDADNNILLILQSEFSGLLIGKNGTTIDSLQHLVNRILNKNSAHKWKITLDIEGYRQRKKDFLVAIARKTAKQVKETGKAVEIEPFPPHDRRIIHMELQSDPQVQTESIGDGYLKNIVISPS